MPTQIESLNKRKNELYAAQEAILNAAAEAKRTLTTLDNEQLDKFSNEITDLEKQVKTLSAIAAGRAELGKATSEIVIPQNASSKMSGNGKRILSAEYAEAFFKGFNGRNFRNAALGEGGTTDGGFLVPTIGPNGEIAALAPLEASMRKLANVIVTTNDLKLAAQASKTVATARATDSRVSNVPFTPSQPAFTQKTVGAYMSGAWVPLTIELSQDVPALQGFLSADLARGVNNYEEDIYINGTGSAEPEGILAGASAGQTAALTSEASLDLTGDLNANYYNNAQWLMHRKTGIAFRKQQLSDNQFNQYFVTVNGKDFLHGFPVNYSSAMPVFVASPEVDGKIAFGDFKAAMTIGDRGGPALQVITDNITQLENGIIRVYGYRRTDSRVLLSEAVKVWTVNG